MLKFELGVFVKAASVLCTVPMIALGVVCIDRARCSVPMIALGVVCIDRARSSVPMIMLSVVCHGSCSV